MNVLNEMYVAIKRRRTIQQESAPLKNLALENLSSEELNSVKSQWSKLGLSIIPLYYKMFKTCEHFDSKWVSDDLFMPVILRALNPRDFAIAYEHKGMYPNLFSAIVGCNLPKVYLNSINGVIYDENVNVVNKDEALSILADVDEFIIKPTTGSCMGVNVRKINPQKENLHVLLDSYGENFMAQEVITQSKIIAQFNPSSLNTFRFTTLYLNGKADVCSILFRCGQGDNAVDNMGAGGLGVGVGLDGVFHPYGYDNKYQKHFETMNGMKFEGTVIPNMKDVIDAVLEMHKKTLPHLAFAGWDIALDKNNDPVTSVS